eukprot:6179638-Pleurochrysis_carterae.AAC.1
MVVCGCRRSRMRLGRCFQYCPRSLRRWLPCFRALHARRDLSRLPGVPATQAWLPPRISLARAMFSQARSTSFSTASICLASASASSSASILSSTGSRTCAHARTRTLAHAHARAHMIARARAHAHGHDACARLHCQAHARTSSVISRLLQALAQRVLCVAPAAHR